MSAESGCSAEQNGVEHFEMQPGEPPLALLVKALSGCADHIGHLYRWPRHLLRTAWFSAGRENRQSIQWADGSAQMPFGHMDVDRGLLQIAVAEKQLDSPQVGAGLQQMGREAVTTMPHAA